MTHPEAEPLAIDSRHGVADIEAALERLRSTPLGTDLLLNTSLRHRQFGGLGALFQLIGTWARRCPRASVRVYITDPDQDRTHLENFLKTDHGLVASLLGYDVRDRLGRRSLRAECLLAATERLAHMNTVAEARRGDRVLMVVADHVPNIAPAALYAHGPAQRQPTPRSWSGFHALAREILRKLKHGEGSRLPSEAVIAQIATIVRELFQNTHDWARHDASGGRLSPSVRGIRAELYQHEGEVHANMVTEEPMLHRYVTDPRLRRPRQRIFELTVFDTGPGIAARRLRQMLEGVVPSGEVAGIDLEYRATVDCLRTHFTTGAASHRGDGLHQVMRTLSELGGFLRVRSGRLALGRDFLETPYCPEGDVAEPYLLDWATGGRAPTALSKVEGTLITLIFPVQYAD